MKNLNWLLAGMGALAINAAPLTDDSVEFQRAETVELADYKQIAYNIQKELVTPEMIDDREAYLYGNVDQLVLGGGAGISGGTPEYGADAACEGLQDRRLG